MKRWKKFSSAVLALTCTLSASIPLSAYADEDSMVEIAESASSYDPCDVNHDGNVNIMDVICVNKFILGSLDVTNYKQLDANENCVVDSLDATYIMGEIVGTDYAFYYVDRKDVTSSSSYSESYVIQANFPSTGSSSTSTTYPNVDVNVYTSRSYSWATYSGTSFVATQSNYTITPTQTTMDSQADEVTSVIGDDTRYNASSSSFREITGIVDINGSTGFIVGDHQIATAAHVVMANGQFESTIEIKTCSTSGKIGSTTLDVQQIHVPTTYKTSSTDVGDYALIVVSDDLSDYVHFSIGDSYNVTATNWQNVPIYVTGQPEDSTSGRYFKTGKGNIYGSGTTNTSFLNYTTDTYFGTSGAPIYTITAYVVDKVNIYYSFTALGVHAFGGTDSNSGVRFTKYHRMFYLANPKNPYADSSSSTS